MPVIIACPFCSGKLRVSDELRGRTVRCPTCDHTFDTAPLPPTAGPRLDPQDLPLQLSLDEPSSEPRSAPADGTPSLFGAVELNPSPKNRQPTPEPPRPSPPTPLPQGERGRGEGRQRPPRPRDDWDLPDIRRRNTEPDRGAVVLTLGIISVVSTALCGPLGLILGLISWIMGQKDLAKMKRGDMDNNGLGMTQAGWICGIIGTILNGLWTLACLGYIGFIVVLIHNTPPPNTRPVVAPAPIQQWPPPPPNPKPPRKRF